MTAASFRARFENAEPFSGSATGQPAAIKATPYAWRDPETLPIRPWLFGRWLLRGTATAAIAPGGIGKTTTLSTIALSIATGRQLIGKTVWDGPGRVWFWNLEAVMDLRAGMIHPALGEYLPQALPI